LWSPTRSRNERAHGGGVKHRSDREAQGRSGL
jgi:hypothetical protein